MWPRARGQDLLAPFQDREERAEFSDAIRGRPFRNRAKAFLGSARFYSMAQMNRCAVARDPAALCTCSLEGSSMTGMHRRATRRTWPRRKGVGSEAGVFQKWGRRGDKEAPEAPPPVPSAVAADWASNTMVEMQRNILHPGGPNPNAPAEVWGFFSVAVEVSLEDPRPGPGGERLAYTQGEPRPLGDLHHWLAGRAHHTLRRCPWCLPKRPSAVPPCRLQRQRRAGDRGNAHPPGCCGGHGRCAARPGAWRHPRGYPARVLVSGQRQRCERAEWADTDRAPYRRSLPDRMRTRRGSNAAVNVSVRHNSGYWLPFRDAPAAGPVPPPLDPRAAGGLARLLCCRTHFRPGGTRPVVSGAERQGGDPALVGNPPGLIRHALHHHRSLQRLSRGLGMYEANKYRGNQKTQLLINGQVDRCMTPLVQLSVAAKPVAQKQRELGAHFDMMVRVYSGCMCCIGGRTLRLRGNNAAQGSPAASLQRTEFSNMAGTYAAGKIPVRVEVTATCMMVAAGHAVRSPSPQVMCGNYPRQ